MAKGGDILDVTHQPEGLVVVLAHLVIGLAKAGFGDGEFGKVAVAFRFHQAPGDSLAGTIEKRLRPHGLIGCLGVAGMSDKFVNLGDVI